MSSANCESFTSSLPIWMPLMYFSCLIATAMNSDTRLHKSDKHGHPCLVPDLRIKALSFLPIS